MFYTVLLKTPLKRVLNNETPEKADKRINNNNDIQDVQNIWSIYKYHTRDITYLTAKDYIFHHRKEKEISTQL